MINVRVVSFCTLALAFVAACHNSAPVNDGRIHAEAHLLDTLGREVGIVRLIETPGITGVQVNIKVDGGATTGQHGIHFHSIGLCNPAGVFSSAGGHFNPAGKKHGLFNPDGPHAGDFEALTLDSFRKGTFIANDTRISLSPGPNSLLDADGSSIVLHALPDDQRTDPSGNSGARVACGVVVRTQ
ncbi:MAG: superoxide dismutase family protein [bacterium]